MKNVLSVKEEHPTRARGCVVAGVIIALSLAGCGNRSASEAFGRYEDFAERARRVGCKFTAENGVPGDFCVAWLGPCNCKIKVSLRGDFRPDADGTKRGVSSVSIELQECAPGRGMEQVYALLDPVFASDEQRQSLRLTLVGPGPGRLTKGSSLSRDIGPVRVNASWSPTPWQEAVGSNPSPDDNERSLLVQVLPTFGKESADKVDRIAHHIVGTDPTAPPCRDGSSHSGQSAAK